MFSNMEDVSSKQYKRRIPSFIAMIKVAINFLILTSTTY